MNRKLQTMGKKFNVVIKQMASKTKIKIIACSQHFEEIHFKEMHFKEIHVNKKNVKKQNKNYYMTRRN